MIEAPGQDHCTEALETNRTVSLESLRQVHSIATQNFSTATEMLVKILLELPVFDYSTVAEQ